MSEINLLEAFGRYNVKPSSRGRSALTQDGTLVVTCWYARFHKAEAGVLRYEEDLSNDTSNNANALRLHLAKAFENEYDVQLIVAMVPQATAPVVTHIQTTARPKATTFHARKDLLGRVTFYDGKRFVIDFRKRAEVAA